MPSYLERLRGALRPKYEVERQLNKGGQGIVFRARDVTLQRPVAIKVLNPEYATERAAQRFLREARLLARLTHPNVMPVHEADEKDGLFYYVMDFFEKETLTERLRRGPLSEHEARKVGSDLLDALEAVHGIGVVHRDVKPGNIFLIGTRAVLADFGIALPTSHSGVSETRRMGTPGYIPPEQIYSEEVTPRADLFAVGVVLYEALTGRTPLFPLRRTDWSGVPRRFVRILKRALQPDPADRWADAATFHRELAKLPWRPPVIPAVASVAVIAAGAFFFWPRHEVFDLAVIPFRAEAGASPQLARDLAMAAELNLRIFFDSTGGRLTPPHVVRGWRNSERQAPDAITPEDLEELQAQHAAVGVLRMVDDGIFVDLAVIRRNGQRESAGAVRVGTLEKTGKRIGLQIARIVTPNHVDRYTERVVFDSVPDDALSAFLRGEHAFQHNAWRTAIDRYDTALAMDSSFALAAWRLSNAWRWGVTDMPHPLVDLPRLAVERRSPLLEVDRMLIEAQLAPTLPMRLEQYRDAIHHYDADGYATFLYGDELLHRGPFVALPLDTAIGALVAAVSKNATFGPALDHLVWAYIRSGRRDSARQWLDQLKQISGDPSESEIYTPPLLELAFVERFAPEQAEATREGMLRTPEIAAGVAGAFRLSAMLGLPRTQLELGQLLAADSRADRHYRGNAVEAQGLALVALGRVREALQRFDSAAALLATAEARLQAAEWRVILPALAIPGVPSEEAERGRAALRAGFSDPHGDLRARAAWALGLDALTRRDSVASAQATEAIRAAGADTVAERLGALLAAAQEASLGRYERALSLTATLIHYDSAGRGGDPFARAVLHLGRADWLDNLGRAAAADSARLWYENFEFVGLPKGEAQASEIDWAVGTFATHLRGEHAFARRRWAAACGHLRRAAELWVDADPEYDALRRSAADHGREACQR